MKVTHVLMLTLAASFAARADFSYTQTTKASQGSPQVTKVFFKGSRMVSDDPNNLNIIDFKAQTITTLNKAAKTYSVKKFSEIVPAVSGKVDPKVDVKKTGQSKTINGFRCTETVMSMSMGAPPPAPAGASVQVEMELWVSADVPGWRNMRTFYKENSSSLDAIAAGSSGLPKIMAELQKKMITASGMPVQQIVRMKTAGIGGAMQPNMSEARARLEQMAKQGGQQGEMAKQALARMPGGGAAMIETTIESSDFSAGAVPDSLFAIPAGFTQK